MELNFEAINDFVLKLTLFLCCDNCLVVHSFRLENCQIGYFTCQYLQTYLLMSQDVLAFELLQKMGGQGLLLKSLLGVTQSHLVS
jgi:hypothetical protein